MQISKNIFTICNLHEVEYSNLLAFFFDTSEIHGFGDLWMKALFNCIDIGEDYPIKTEIIKREVVTPKKGQIDLLIITENSVIGIEHKINASLENDLIDYSKKIIQTKKETKKKKHYQVVLAPLWYADRKKIPPDWIFVSHSALFEEVQKLSEYYIATPDSYWLQQMNSLLNIPELHAPYRKDILEFLHRPENRKGNRELKTYCYHSIFKYFNQLQNLLEERKSEFQPKFRDVFPEVKKDYNDVFFVSVAIGRNKSNKIYPETYITSNGWQVALFIPKKTYRDTLRKYGISAIDPKNIEFFSNRFPLTPPIPFENYEQVIDWMKKAVEIIDRTFKRHKKRKIVAKRVNKNAIQ